MSNPARGAVSKIRVANCRWNNGSRPKANVLKLSPDIRLQQQRGHSSQVDEYFRIDKYTRLSSGGITRPAPRVVVANTLPFSA
jgi:hypothetical protein